MGCFRGIRKGLVLDRQELCRDEGIEEGAEFVWVDPERRGEGLNPHRPLFERGEDVELHPGCHGKRGVDGLVQLLNRFWPAEGTGRLVLVSWCACCTISH